MTQAQKFAPAEAGQEAPDLRLFVFALFFIFGGITSLNDVLIPKLKELFTLSYAQVMLVQFFFFAAYFFISIPAAAIVKRMGYMRAAVVGLLTMMAGCLLFVPASFSAVFEIFLFALFVLATGITIIQVVTNPLISLLGKPETAHSRLTFAQAFNSLGTMIFPYVGSVLILRSLNTVDPAALSGTALAFFRRQETRTVAESYVGLAVVLALLAWLVWLRRDRLAETISRHADILRSFDLLKRPRFAFGTACIFLYVGAEVAIGSLIVNYLEQASTLGLAAEDAGKHVPFYWGGALVGRVIGSYVLRQVSPGKVLAFNAGMVVVLILISANSAGLVSGWSLLAIGLFNSIMFPTIFSLASEGLGPRAADGSGLLCVAIVGGAIVPLITGRAADLMGLKASLVVPAICYLGILGFGLFARHAVKAAPLKMASSH
ncbi:MAG TPA: sugar MFS transporter [Rhizomicrobium sp.]|nr:sugar MFS transporter [Rhizomicrobium sp.]